MVEGFNKLDSGFFSGSDPNIPWGGQFSIDSDLATGHTYELGYYGAMFAGEDPEWVGIYWDNVRRT